MILLERIRTSFSAQLSLWVAGFVVIISAVVILLLARFSEQVIRDELTDTTQQTLENTALRIRHAIRQSEIIAQLEHKPFKLDKAYVDNLLEEYKPRQLSQIQITDHPDKAGQRNVTELSHHGVPSYRFYEPVKGTPYGLVVIVPAKAIYSHFFDMQLLLLSTGIIGVLLLQVICSIVIVRHLRPLRQLAFSAQRIAGGHLDEPIPDSKSKDEIGKLQNSLAKMQRSLNSYLEEIRRKQSMLSSQNAKLQETYREAQEYAELKSKFIHEMTNKMSMPVRTVCQNTETICDDYANLTKDDMNKIQADILSATEEITQLLDQLLNTPREASIYDVPSDTPTPPAT